MIRVVLKTLLILVVFATLVLLTGVWHLDKTWNQERVFNDQIFTIEKGDSIRKISRKFHQKGTMLDAYSFALLGIYNGTATQIKAGNYVLDGGLNAHQLLEKFINGEVITYKLSLVEGWTFKQFREKIAQDEYLQLLTTDWSDDEIMQKIGAQHTHPEGQFYPDTYIFRATDSDLTILKQAYLKMQQLKQQLWDQRDSDTPLKNKEEALILASIIEKETGKADERPEIGGVFVNRLNKGMLLQTDPTIIYGLGDEFKGNLTRKHLDSKKNRYNTYQHEGLPPTPIAMPGFASIKAAVNPKSTDKFYFVAKGDGSHYFSASYNEHRKAVNKFQIRRKK